MTAVLVAAGCFALGSALALLSWARRGWRPEGGRHRRDPGDWLS